MKGIFSSLLPAQRRSLRRFLLRRGFWILGGFTALFLVTVPPITSDPPYPEPVLLPARIALASGVVTWAVMFLVCVQSFFIPAERPSFIASFTFFLLFGLELLLVAGATHVP
jgi:uncharacterized protein YhhL (DUF1145 family)